MKKNILILGIIFLILTGCNKNLDTKDLLNKNESNFPYTEADVNTALAAIYKSMSGENTTWYYSNIISDEMFAGGGAGEMEWLDQIKRTGVDQFEVAWQYNYQGIYRANKLLESWGNIPKFSSDDIKNQLLGETYFMRAYFYFELVRLFGDVPLLVKSDLANIPRTPAKNVYAQIGSDLKKAIETFPSIPITAINISKRGHATKWAAEGMMARVFLFYTGYYKVTDLPLAEGGTVTKEQVVGYLNDCIDNSGHDLVNDFRNFWPYTSSPIVEKYSYTKGKGLHWIGENGANHETVFAIQYGPSLADWSNFDDHNTVVTNYSIRGQDVQSTVLPFGAGWGFGCVNPRMFEQWKTDEPNDMIRQFGSVAEILNPREGVKEYTEGGWEQQNETHLWQKKYMQWMTIINGNPTDYSVPLYGIPDAGFYLMSSQDLVLMRFSDILLMQSELSASADKMNRVRARVGLPAVGYSLAALQKERQHELCFEGVRYYDLLRWYGADAGAVIDANQNGVEVENNKTPVNINFNLTGRIKATGGFLEIPTKQIRLSNDVLTQNAGWGPEANF